MTRSLHNAPGDVLVSIGDLVEDIVVWTAGPTLHATDNSATIVRTRGGGAANVAAFAAVAGPTRFIGRIGDDATGTALAAQLTGAGVDVRVQRAGRTGVIVILVDGHGERTMYPDRAAAADLAGIPAEWIDGAGVVNVSGYCFATEHSRAAVLDLLTVASTRGIATSVDVASVGLIEEFGVAAFLDLLRTAPPDVLFANADEAELLGLSSGRWPRTTVVIKDGPRPVTVIEPDGQTSRIAVATPVGKVRDTTGAGDAFTAGYLRAFLNGQGPASCASNGNRVASAVLTTPGAAFAQPPTDTDVRAGTAEPERSA